eukprot:Em0026g51a
MHGGLEEEKGLLAEEHTSPSDTRLMFVTGVIARERLPVFQRVLWRACRGNVFLRHTQIEEYLEDPASGNLVSKCVFILFFQGDQLRTRVKKICEGFRATLYECPETQVQRVELRVTVGNRIEDLKKVLVASNEYSVQKLREIADEIEAWLQKVTKMKAIFHTLNMFNLDVTRQCLISECWCPVQDLPHIQLALRRGMEKSGSSVPCIFNQMRTDEKPPTYFRTNEFTGGFQAIVDAYGVASYREVNPTPYTIVTFPFLFAVMFGDAGHGLLMTLFAFTLLIFQKRLKGVKNEMFSMLFSGRYLLLLMGIFSIYTGLIYNDVFSKPLNIFGSSWRPYYYGASFSFAEMENMTYPENIMYCAPVGGNHSKDISCNPRPNEGDMVVCNSVWCATGGTSTKEVCTLPTEAQLKNQPYPFGLDPVWAMADNELIFTNPYKMKMSIVLGVMQMLFGVILSVINYVFFKKYIRIFAEFIPQVLFLLSLFGWLMLLIFWKWVSYYPDATKAPNLLITLIYMFLKLTSASPDGVTEFSVFGTSASMANIQSYTQKVLVGVMVLCVPWMLFMKPIYIIIQRNMKKRRQATYVSIRAEECDDIGAINRDTSEGERDHDAANVKVHQKKRKLAPPTTGGGGEHGDDVPIGELFVYQSIHTIEYCLGTISNTASYLRLWALGLAHQQLALVLWTMVLDMAIHFGVSNVGLGVIILFFLWAFWAALTVAILLIMEGLSAFLHALRLHWIEFQNKFYEGEGYEFVPFSFSTLLSSQQSTVE